ncbi:MAG: hypothetical protein KGS60_13135 [Verrucomicrobia bacterium]|nr:hypothetical protein [Verrucomicrobiota bacterium]
MKITRFIKWFSVGVAWAALSASAFSQTVIRIVGSNGDRVATQNAIAHILDNGTSFSYRGTNGSNSSTTVSTGTASPTLSVASAITGSNFGAWNGTYGGNNVVIKVTFSGALAGIAAVAGNTDQRFVPNDGTGSGATVNPLTGTTQGTDYEVGKADFGFSTNFQTTSPFNGVFQGTTYSTVVEEIVGISPLGFYASPGFPGSPSNTTNTTVQNITTQLARQLYTIGSVSLAQFTGDWTNDKNKIVYALGRNTDAGQRFGAYTEIGLGTTTQVRVYFPTVSGSTTSGSTTFGGTAITHELWPINQQPGSFAVALGSGGYSSGALISQNLTVVLGADAYKSLYDDPETVGPDYLYPDATAGYYIGYVTPGDASSRIVGGVVPTGSRGVALKFNGVELTNANVQNGTYTAWVYNRILKPQSGAANALTGTKLTFANALRDQIRNTDAATSGLKDDASVFVKRSTDGGDVVPK